MYWGRDMNRKNSIQNRDTEEAISRIDEAIHSRYPDANDSQTERLRGKVLNYVGDGMSEGYDVAMIKRNGAKSILKVLKLIREDND
jgi:hypothetical protein